MRKFENEIEKLEFYKKKIQIINDFLAHANEHGAWLTEVDDSGYAIGTFFDAYKHFGIDEGKLIREQCEQQRKRERSEAPTYKTSANAKDRRTRKCKDI